MKSKKVPMAGFEQYRVVRCTSSEEQKAAKGLPIGVVLPTADAEQLSERLADKVRRQRRKNRGEK